ncbi:MAG: sugar phosphate nucleotidyltransferase [Elusimicrobiota bacterium]
MINLAVVPVAGIGTRLLPATKSQPKEMLPVGRKPVVQYVVEELEKSGITNILFVTGRNKTSIENHFDADNELIRGLRETGKEELLSSLEYEKLDVKYFYTRQRQPKGLGDAILQSEEYVSNQPFVVALGDSIIGLHANSKVVKKLTDCFVDKAADCVIAFEEVNKSEVCFYGIAKPATSGKVFQLSDVVEKPAVAEAPSNLAIAARYVFSPNIFGFIRKVVPDKRGEIQITDAIRMMIHQGMKVYGVKLNPGEKRYDIGNFESYFETVLEFILSDPEFGESVKKKVKRIVCR